MAVITPDAVLAVLERRGEGREVVVDPGLLAVVTQVGSYYPQRFTGGG